MSERSRRSWNEDLSSAASFSHFYRTHLPVVFGYVLRLAGGDTVLAEDLTQETFLSLTSQLKAGRHDVADIRWLLVVARNKFLDHARREGRNSRTLRLAASSQPDPEDSPPSRADVLDSMDALAPMQRAALMMRYVDGMSTEAIARDIGRSVPATYSLLARARHELRTLRADS